MIFISLLKFITCLKRMRNCLQKRSYAAAVKPSSGSSPPESLWRRCLSMVVLPRLQVGWALLHPGHAKHQAARPRPPLKTRDSFS